MSDSKFDIEHFPTSATAIRMMSRISPIYDRAYVAKWIFEVMGAELGTIRQRYDELTDQGFPETATWGLIYWEQRYGIKTDTSKSLDDRRAEVLTRRDARAPMSPARVEAILNSLTGLPVHVTEDVAPYTFQVEIDTGTRPVDLIRVYERLLKIKPSHQAVQLATRHKTMETTTAFGAGMGHFSTTPLPELKEEHSFSGNTGYAGATLCVSNTVIPVLGEYHSFGAIERATGTYQTVTMTTLPEADAESGPFATDAMVSGATAAITSTILPEFRP